MRLHNILEDGKIVQGVNTTVDVKPGETERQAKKYFGGNGKPKALGGDDTHKLFNMGLTESANLDSEVVTEDLLNEEDLFEINMSPSGLANAVKDINALAGIEFEMIVPDVEDPEGHGEEDLSNDINPRDWDDVENFFEGGHGENYSGDIESMKDAMVEKYHEWAYDQIHEDIDIRSALETWFDENVSKSDYFEAAKQEVLAYREDEIEAGEISEEELEDEIEELAQDKWDEAIEESYDQQDERYEEVRDELEQEWFDEHDFDYWINNNYRWCENIWHEFGIDNDVMWPHISGMGGEESMDSVADDFSDAIGRPVNVSGSYHGGSRTEGEYDVEPDSSLSGDGAGLEFISPPLPIDEMIKDIRAVHAYANQNNWETNGTTGLHMNISTENFDKDNMDLTKLLLLYGETHVLKSFGRQSNSYAESLFKKLSEKFGKAGATESPTYREAMKDMRNSFNTAAGKALMTSYNGKFVSVNTQSDNRVEFRGPGSDWLNQSPDMIVNTLMRFVVALDAACDPDKYRNEYHKKLYKMLTQTVEDSKYPEFAKAFAKFVSGKHGGREEYDQEIEMAKQSRKDSREDRIKAAKEKKRVAQMNAAIADEIKGASQLYHYDSGLVKEARWTNSWDKPHREDGPAQITYKEDGSKDGEKWYKNGNIHREDGPAQTAYENGKVRAEAWAQHDEKHRLGGPAVIFYNDAGSVEKEIWYLDGKRDRDPNDGPAYIVYNEDGSINTSASVYYQHGEIVANPNDEVAQEQEKVAEGADKIERWTDGKISIAIWRTNGEVGREDGPAELHWDMNGSLDKEMWQLDGQFHRADGPALTYYYGDGKPRVERYIVNGNSHREDGPGYIEYYQDGNVKEEKYYKNGDRHREDGPQRIRYDTTGKAVILMWYVDDRYIRGESAEMDADDYEAEVKRVDAMKNDPPHKEVDNSDLELEFGDEAPKNESTERFKTNRLLGLL